MNKLIIAMFLIISAMPAFAQFSPDEIGYDFSVQKLYSHNKINKAFVIIVAVDRSVAHVGDTVDVYSFSQNGWLTQHVSYNNPAPGNTITLEYKYNAIGRLTTTTNIGFEVIPFSISYVYDTNGKLVESSINGEMPRRDGYLYDSKGNVIQRTGEVFMSATDSNAASNKAKKWIPVDRDKYVWNDDRTLHSESFYSNDKLYTHVTCDYNDSKQLIYLHYYADEEKIQSGGSTMFIYSDEGLPVVRIEYNAYGDRMEQLKYVYE